MLILPIYRLVVLPRSRCYGDIISRIIISIKDWEPVKHHYEKYTTFVQNHAITLHYCIQIPATSNIFKWPTVYKSNKNHSIFSMETRNTNTFDKNVQFIWILTSVQDTSAMLARKPIPTVYLLCSLQILFQLNNAWNSQRWSCER